MLNDIEYQMVVYRWPNDNAGLPPRIIATYRAWMEQPTIVLKEQFHLLRPASRGDFPPLEEDILRHFMCVALTAHSKSPSDEPAPAPDDIRQHFLRPRIDDPAQLLQSILERRLKLEEDEKRSRLQYMSDLDASAIENIRGKADRWHADDVQAMRSANAAFDALPMKERRARMEREMSSVVDSVERTMSSDHISQKAFALCRAALDHQERMAMISLTPSEPMTGQSFFAQPPLQDLGGGQSDRVRHPDADHRGNTTIEPPRDKLPEAARGEDARDDTARDQASSGGSHD